MVGEVYRIINLVNDKSYVGITGVGIDNRFKGHLQSKNSTMVLPAAINKYGPENFIIEKLDEAETAEELYEMEKFYIKEYESHISLGKGYNLTWGGNGTFGDLNPMRDSEVVDKHFKETNHMKLPEHRARMSGENNPAKRPEVRAKLSGDNNPAKRPEVRQKISNAWEGRDPQIMKDMGLSIRGENHPANKPETAHIWHEDNAAKRPEVRTKISKKLKGVPKPSISGENNPAKRPEVRAKISKATKGKPKSKPCHGKEVTIDGVTYISITAAKRALGWTDGEMYRYTTRGTTEKLPHLCGEDHPCKQLDVRKKISENTKGKGCCRTGGKNGSAKMVIVDDVIYQTMKEASETTGITICRLRRLIRIGVCKIIDKNILSEGGK